MARRLSLNSALRLCSNGGKQESRRARKLQRLVFAPRGLSGCSTLTQSGTKLFQSYFMDCFNCFQPLALGSPSAPMQLLLGGEPARLSEANLGLLPVSGRGNRVKPTQAAKPRKITVCGAQCKPVFHSQRGQMGIGYEIAMHSWQREEFA